MAASGKDKFGRLIKIEEKKEIPHYCGVSKILKKFSVIANASEKEWANPSAAREHTDLNNCFAYMITVHGEQGVKPECQGAFQLVLFSQVTTWAAGSDAARDEWLQALVSAGVMLKVPALADWMSKKGRWGVQRRYFRTEKTVSGDALCYYETIHKSKPNGTKRGALTTG